MPKQRSKPKASREEEIGAALTALGPCLRGLFCTGEDPPRYSVRFVRSADLGEEGSTPRLRSTPLSYDLLAVLVQAKTDSEGG